jgi:hypothetical protein
MQSTENAVPEVPPELGASPQSIPSLKSMTASKAAKMFPHGDLVRRAINKRYAAIVGYGIDGRRLFQVLTNLGTTDWREFIVYLDGQGYSILGNSGSYAHFPHAAKHCAAFVRNTSASA